MRRCAEKASKALPAHAKELAPANLVALQPNAHAGNRHLPRHLDWPRHDGFGVVIVTVAVRGAGTVVLESRSGDIVRFELPEGHAYCLAGAARHAWLHGVVGADPERESLNLRFGLHSHARARAVGGGSTRRATRRGRRGTTGAGLGRAWPCVCNACV